MSQSENFLFLEKGLTKYWDFTNLLITSKKEKEKKRDLETKGLRNKGREKETDRERNRKEKEADIEREKKHILQKYWDFANLLITSKKEKSCHTDPNWIWNHLLLKTKKRKKERKKQRNKERKKQRKKEIKKQQTILLFLANLH